MRTLSPPISKADRRWLDDRRRLGQDLYDEVWEGAYKVAPAPTPAHGDLDHQLPILLSSHARSAGLHGSGPLNLGDPDDYRVPDRCYRRDRRDDTYLDTVALVVEILSPGDDSRAKLGFYHDHHVEEVLLVDPRARSVEWLVRGGRGYEPAEGSTLLGVTATWLAAAIDWPPTQ